MPKPITTKMREGVLAMLREGATYEKAAIAHELTVHTVRKIAREAGHVSTHNRTASDERKEMIARLLRLGLSQSEVCRRLKCGPALVRRMQVGGE